MKTQNKTGYVISNGTGALILRFGDWAQDCRDDLDYIIDVIMHWLEDSDTSGWDGHEQEIFDNYDPDENVSWKIGTTYQALKELTNLRDETSDTAIRDFANAFLCKIYDDSEYLD